MGINVNTQPSVDTNSISIRWITFCSKEKENTIEAKKMKIGKGAYVPEVGKVHNDYIVEKNNKWMRCIKSDNKLKRVRGADIEDEEKIKSLEDAMERKYLQKSENNR